MASNVESLPPSPSARPEGERRVAQPPTPKARGSADWRYVATAFALVVAVFLVLAGFIYSEERSRIAGRQFDVLQSLARDGVKELAIWRRERLDEARRFADNPSYVRAIDRYFRTSLPGPVWPAFFNDVEVMLSRPHYDAVFLLDLKGEVRFVAGRGLRRGLRLDGEVQATLRGREPRFHAVGEGGQIRIRLLTPLVDQRGKTVGLLGFQIIPQRDFAGSIVGNLPIADAVAEVLVVSDGRVISPRGQTNGKVALSSREPLRDGFFEAVDEQGEAVVASEMAVEGTPWVLVTRVEAKAFAEAFRRLTFWTITMLLSFLGASSGLAYLTWRRGEARYKLRESEAQRELALLERRFDYLAKYANDAIYLADQDGRLVEVNDKTVELYGYDRDTLKGMNVSRLRAPKEASRFTEDWQRINANASVVYETTHMAADGREFSVEVSARQIVAERGHFVQFIVRDISERKRAERRVRRQSDLYAALSRANEAIAHFTSEEVLLPEICRIAVALGGYGEAHVAIADGRGELGIVASYVRPSSTAEEPQAHAGPSRVQGLLTTAYRENHAVVRDGYLAGQVPAGEASNSAAAFPLRRADRLVGAFGVVARDREAFDEDQTRLLQDLALDISLALENLEIDARRRTAERLTLDSETRYRTLFENMGSGVMVLVRDEQGFIVKDLNTAMERMERIQRKDVLGRRLRDAFGWAHHCLVPVAEEVWRGGGARAIPAHCHANDHRGWRESYIYRLPTDELVAVVDDVTQRITAMADLRSSEERLALVLEVTNDAYWDLDFETGGMYYSHRLMELFAYTPEEMGTTLESWQRLVHPNDAIDVQRLLADHLTGKTPQFLSEHRMRHKTRGYIWIRVRGRVVRRAEDGRPLRMVGTHLDITEDRVRGEQLRQWATVFEHSHEAIIVADARRHILSVNRAFTEITGYTLDEVKGRDPHVLSSGIHDRAFYQTLWASIAESGHWQGEIQDRRKNGEIFPLWLAITAAKDEHGDVRNYIAIGSDMSERKESEERIRYLAYHDALTELPNRALFGDRLAFALAHARRQSFLVAVLFLDLDRFKDVNDSLGHDKGDDLLAVVADRLRSCVRSEDTVGRQGGDEFLVLLTDLHLPQDAVSVARKILEDVSAPLLFDGEEVRVTTSIGMALYPEDGGDPDTLIRSADAAMYYAKERGRNNFQFFSEELNRRARSRLSLETSLRHAIAAEQFELVYQPQVHLESGAVVGVEALLRWRVNGSLVPPSKFLPLAEETGLILPLGEWVVRKACQQQEAWVAQGFPRVPMAVNVSASEFRKKEWPQRLRGLLRDCPGKIEMELSERFLLEDAGADFAVLRALVELGVAPAIHDFGSGCMSPGYLRQMLVKHLKLDPSFVHGLVGDPFRNVLMEAFVKTAGALGIRVTALGAERDEEIRQLRIHHCEEVQGNYTSPPLAAGEFEAWWRAHPASTSAPIR